MLVPDPRVIRWLCPICGEPRKETKLHQEQKAKAKYLTGRDARVCMAFLRSVVFTYDSRWLLEKTGDAAKACVPHFKRAWTASYMSPKERDAYLGMFTKEVIFNLQARWYIEVTVWFRDRNGVLYPEQGQLVSGYGKINDVMPEFERLRDDLKAAGNHLHYLHYEWRAEVYKDQPLFETLDDEEAA